MHIIYNLDPRTKILLVFILTLLIFLIDSLFVAIIFLLSILLIRIAARIPFRDIKTFKILSMLVLFLIFVQTLLGPGENYIVKPLFPPGFPLLGGRGSLKWDGLFIGLMLGCRLTVLMLVLPLLTETTSPYRVAAGLAALGINYRAAFVITTALNLIPVFEEQGKIIIDAQKMRFMRSFEESSFPKKLKALTALVVPLVLSAMRKAQSASVAMDCRAFGAFKTRSWLEKPVMKKSDYLVLAGGIVFFVLILIMELSGNFYFW